MMRRAAAGLSAVLLVVALAGCSGDWLLGGESPTPGQSAETPEPGATTSATPSASPEECEDLVIDEPGDYDLGDCGSLTLEGDRIEVTAVSIGELIIRGDRNAVAVAGGIDSVIVVGDDNLVATDGPLGFVTENGRGNEIG